MGRVKEMEDKAKAPKINKDASKRFVRNALWSQAQKKSTDNEPGKSSDHTALILLRHNIFYYTIILLLQHLQIVENLWIRNRKADRVSQVQMNSHILPRKGKDQRSIKTSRCQSYFHHSSLSIPHYSYVYFQIKKM